ncbi:leukocyte immunoglobulin-like receptor subfamily B member 5 isoform X2 [Sagmatias obliquidens]|nr:leukocyte immunoglobulin-like receptor subfamily B member 3 isoform X2 [Lagenorhynchus obliquidens]
MYRKPSLLAQLGASGTSRENVTLQCGSEVWSNPLHLSKEGSLTPLQNLRLQDMALPFLNNFTLSPVTSAHSGTYTCYSSLSTSPSLMTQPSDPCSSCSGLKWYLNILTGVSVAFVLLPLVLVVRHRGQSRRRKSAAAASVLEDRGRQKRQDLSQRLPPRPACAQLPHCPSHSSLPTELQPSC